MYVKRKALNNSFINWIDQKDILGYYPELDSHSTNKIKFELDLSNYARKFDAGKAKGIHQKFLKN